MPGIRGSRRLLAAGLVVVVVLLGVIAGLAFRLSGSPPTASAAVAAANPKLDIATLTPAKLPQVVVPANLGGGADVGASVVAIGNPLGLTDSVSAGVISGLDRTADTDHGKFSGLIQFDASVNPGSSGGPLLDAHGRIVGVVVSLATPDGQDAFAGIGFAVPIGTALGSGGKGPGGKGPQI